MLFVANSAPAIATIGAPLRSAKPTCRPLLNEANFYLMNELPHTLDSMSATPQLKLTVTDPTTHLSERVSCSSTIISDSGLILTAAHCLSGCVKDAKAKKNGAFVNSQHEIVCQVAVSGVETAATIKVMGHCPAPDIVESIIAATHPDFQSEMSPAMRETCKNEDEIAIIEPIKKQTKNAHCLPLVFANPAVGEKLATQGYPARTHRLDGVDAHHGEAKDAPGGQLTWSTGARIESPTCHLRPQNPELDEGEDAPMETTDELRGRFLQTTVDFVKGSSGGPLLNSRGEVVGVASLINPFARELDPQKTLNPIAEECRGSTFFSPTTKIQSMIAKQAPQLFQQLKCEQHRAKEMGQVEL